MKLDFFCIIVHFKWQIALKHKCFSNIFPFFLSIHFDLVASSVMCLHFGCYDSEHSYIFHFRPWIHLVTANVGWKKAEKKQNWKLRAYTETKVPSVSPWLELTEISVSSVKEHSVEGRQELFDSPEQLRSHWTLSRFFLSNWKKVLFLPSRLQAYYVPSE